MSIHRVTRRELLKLGGLAAAAEIASLTVTFSDADAGERTMRGGLAFDGPRFILNFS